MTTTLARVRVVGSGLDAATARQRLAAVLAAAELRPPGLPPAALLVVRQVSGLPGGLLEAAPPTASAPAAWEAAIVAVLADELRSAARPAHGPVPLAATAVLFADRAELLACLARDVLDGTAPLAWWWRGTLAGAPGVLEGALRAWLDAARQVPAALELLAGWSRAPAWVAAIPAVAVGELAARVAGAFALPDARGARPRRGEPAPWADLAPEAADPTLDAARQRLLGVALALRRDPARARTVAFARAVHGWERAQAKAAPAAPGASPRPQPAHATREDAPAAEVGVLAPRPAHEARPHRVAPVRHDAGPAPDRALAPSPRTEGPPPVSTAARSASGGPQSSGATMPSHAPEAAAVAPRAAGGPPPTAGAPRRHERVSTTSKRPVPPRPVEDAVGTAGLPDPGWAAGTVVPAAPGHPACGTAQPAPIEPAAVADAAGPPTAATAPHAPPIAAEAVVGPTVPQTLTGSRERPVDTGLGGLFYLLNLALQLDLYGDFTRPRDPGIELDPWDLVELLGLRLLGERPPDRVWELLGSLAARPPGSPPGRGYRPLAAWRVAPAWLGPLHHTGTWIWSAAGGVLRVRHPAGFLVIAVARTAAAPAQQLRRELTRLARTAAAAADCAPAAAHELVALAQAARGGAILVRATLPREPADPLARWIARLGAYAEGRLRRVLGLGPGEPLDVMLLRHRARVFVSPTHVDVVLALDALPIAVRIAGLDRTPGWVPSTGRTVALHFE